MEALKPCPWCARTETLSVDTEANTCTGNPPQQWYASVCCLCFDGDFCYPVTATGQTEEEAKEKAIRSWNHRPIEDALRARIAQLEAVAEAANDVVYEKVDINPMYDFDELRDALQAAGYKGE